MLSCFCLIVTKNKNKKYSISEKKELAKLCIKLKEEYDKPEKNEKNNAKKRKFVNSSSNTASYLSKAVRELYALLRNKPSESNEFKKAIQVVRRCYQSYTADTNKDEPVNKKKFHQSGGGCKPVALEVCMEIF